MGAHSADPDRAKRARARALFFARILGAVGRSMITAGVLILLFVVYQLWGTGIRTAQSQHRLDAQFADILDQAHADLVDGAATTTTPPTTVVDPSSTTTPTTRPPGTTVDTLPPELLPQSGQAAGHIVIPRIGVDLTFVEGVGVSDLKLGPGHYPGTPLPGQAGNSAIAGHRTTYGAPFANVDQLQIGDEIDITTVQGQFTYVVDQAPVIVGPSQVEVLDPDHWGEGDWLTLTACHPKYSARQRIVIAARLRGPAAPTTARPVDPAQPEQPVAFEEATLSGERAGAWPAVFWAGVCAVIWIVSWALGKVKRRLRWPAYVLGIFPFLVALFFFFENFSRLLPANF